MITEKDCIGAIKGYPPHIVELMLDEQEKQNNPRNVAVFQEKADAGYFEGGFNWRSSTQGPRFWSSIHNARNFDIYPYKEAENEEPITLNNVVETPVTQDEKEEDGFIPGALVRVTSLGKRKEKILLCALDTPGGKVYICITKEFYKRLLTEDVTRASSVCSYRDGVELINSSVGKVRLTLKDISEGKGVGIPPELIEIVN